MVAPNTFTASVPAHVVDPSIAAEAAAQRGSGLVPDQGEDPLNTKMAPASAGKWQSTALKASWFEDHVGFDVSALESVENRVRNFEAKFNSSNEEGGGSRDIERFFDLFEPRGG
jgi:hypothetical protein